jgi:trehalose 6-phosphate phosphatase
MKLQVGCNRPPPLDEMDAAEWALFLDLDGTLIDLASTPDSVSVEPGLVPVLATLRESLDGALAILSGRSLAVIDRLLYPLAAIAGGEHGAVVRLPQGEIEEAPLETKVPQHWRDAIRARSADWPGLLIEEKAHSVALHYRANPALGADVASLLAEFVAENPAFEVLPALMARELRHSSINKGTALCRLMEQRPFRGRRPLFIGDDVTDEDAVAAAGRMGGAGLMVPDAFASEPARVRTWLAGLAQTFLNREKG